ncbi:hypothetical protein D1781_11420 [Amnibacterium setariae]|uniref:Uncharacterized protein n=1 Tax=Amnibacterium setariae TaxID=2306585 RepID=A0A3A1TWA9_9MICO|nr:hypothetical protein D1781_11420 [Amnibacterium setariae]
MQHADAAAVAGRLRQAWSRSGAVTEGFRFRDAEVEVDGVIRVAFDWRRDPQRYAVRIPFPGWIRDAIGDGFTAREAVDELSLRLMEELDTGFVSRAARTPDGDVVLLEDRAPRRTGWCVGDVPLEQSASARERALEQARRTGRSTVVVAGRDADDLEPVADPGRHLDDDGLDGSAGRAAVRAGDLIAWLQLDRGDLASRFVGQAVVTRLDGSTARVALLELRTSDPAAAEDLAIAACRRAVEAGAQRIEAPRDLDLLLDLGFRAEGEVLAARYDEVRPPEPCGRSGAPA